MVSHLSCFSFQVQYFLQFWVKLVDIAGRKMRLRIIYESLNTLQWRIEGSCYSIYILQCFLQFCVIWFCDTPILRPRYYAEKHGEGVNKRTQSLITQLVRAPAPAPPFNPPANPGPPTIFPIRLMNPILRSLILQPAMSTNFTQNWRKHYTWKLKQHRWETKFYNYLMLAKHKSASASDSLVKLIHLFYQVLWEAHICCLYCLGIWIFNWNMFSVVLAWSKNVKRWKAQRTSRG